MKNKTDLWKAGWLSISFCEGRFAFVEHIEIEQSRSWPAFLKLKQMIDVIVNQIKQEVVSVFGDLDHWFSADENILNCEPGNGGWNIKKILEHISLTNHFLLILIRKGSMKAISYAANVDFSDALTDYEINWSKLKAIGEHQSFYWNRPAHMEPTGTVDLNNIRATLKEQLGEILSYLEQLKNGEGVLYKTTMTVNDLGKIDVYHYILFLAMHVKRHITQMEKVNADFGKS